ncbi:MAG: methionyl-tRNA formyltransferase [Woeseiaceae bacterium]
MKIAVVTNGGFFARIILDKCMRNPDWEIGGIVVISGDYFGNTGLKSLWKVGRQTYWVYVLYKVFVHFLFKILALLRSERLYDVNALAEHCGIPVINVTTVGDPAVQDFVETQNPDVLLSVSCPQRIKKQLLETASKAAINIHSSLLPDYAGLAPYFWVLAEGESVTGTTVHYMAEKFDEGHVVIQKEVPIPSRCSAFRLFASLSKAGSDAVDQALQAISNGATGTPQDLSRASYFSHPTKASYLKLSRRGHCLITIGDILSVLKGKIQ